jgi:hypothetical protein
VDGLGVATSASARRGSPGRQVVLVLGAVVLLTAVAFAVFVVKAIAVANVTASTREADAVSANGGILCSTSWDEWTDVPGVSETFSFGGTTDRRVIVLFTAGVGGTGDNHYLTLRLRIDGVTQPPGAVTVNYPSSPARTGAFNFISERLEPGSHTAKLQYRITVGLAEPGQGCLYNPSMVILHD